MDAELVVIHLIDFDGRFGDHPVACNGAVAGDKAITIEQAKDPENQMFFNCPKCYEIFTGEKPNGE